MLQRPSTAGPRPPRGPCITGFSCVAAYRGRGVGPAQLSTSRMRSVCQWPTHQGTRLTSSCSCNSRSGPRFPPWHPTAFSAGGRGLLGQWFCGDSPGGLQLAASGAPLRARVLAFVLISMAEKSTSLMHRRVDREWCQRMGIADAERNDAEINDGTTDMNDAYTCAC